MRRLRRCPARVRLCVSLALLTPLALPMTLAGCAAPAPTAAGMVDTYPSGVGAAAIVASPRTRPDESPSLTRWFAASADPCSNACLSAAEQDAIIARAIAEHEMRRP
jgi:hypothetical protein